MAGPLLIVLGVLLCGAAVLVLPWNPQALGEGEFWNGIDQALINIDAGRAYGWAMVVAFVVAFAGGLTALVGAVMAMTGRRGGTLALTGGIVGFLGTFGVVAGYLALGAIDESTGGMWAYGLSFVIVLVGAGGVASQKY